MNGNGLDVNNLLSKKLGIALFTIYTIGNGGADPMVVAVCQSVIAIAALFVFWLLEKEKNNEKDNTAIDANPVG